MSTRNALVGGILFILVTPVILWFDSGYFFRNYFDGRWLANVLVIFYFLWLFRVSGSHLRKLIVAMVILSYIGELIFCSVLGMYHYRTEAIPLYVPLGHAIVYISGYIYAHAGFALKHQSAFNKIFPLLFLIIFLVPGLFLNDLLTLLFGICFFAILKRKKWQNLYFFLALCVIYIELLGTSMHCWTWVSHTFGVIPTVNPPMGAVFIYAGGDVLIAKIAGAWEKRLAAGSVGNSAQEKT